ncbi:MAG: 1-deoxy-D-xylulose-5-phosphate reductoisomerase, partial [Planctomycetota bacterium]
GERITIDSATLMNKALEIIEAKYLFDICVEKIKVLIHPQSIFHAFVELKDSTIMGLLHKPDMKIPILFGLYYPYSCDRIENLCDDGYNIDWSAIENLQFISRSERLRNIELAYIAATRGHNFEIALNSADEVAVEYFLKYKIKFTDITTIVEKILNSISFQPIESVSEAINYDREIKLKTHALCKQYF